MQYKGQNIFQRRKIEAELLKSVVEGLSSVYDKETILENVRSSIEKIAYRDGQEFRKQHRNNNLFTLAKHWIKLGEGESLHIEDIKLSPTHFKFRVTYCKYAEYYRDLKAENLGRIISCCRDQAFLSGYSDDIEMERSTTILEGNPSCDFVYRYKTKHSILNTQVKAKKLT